MTEAEWLVCGDAERMLMSVGDGYTPRKTRLFAVACAMRIWHRLDEQLRRTVVVADKFADGLATQAELTTASRSLQWEHGYVLPEGINQGAFEVVSWAVMERRELYPSEAASAAWWALIGFFNCDVPPGQRWDEVREARCAEASVQAGWVRDIFGNPFRPVAIDPAWLTSDVVALARGIYDERAFDRMPILADALQDAGCDNADILDHCRDPKATHVRGCWVVDLVLGKE